MGPGQTRRSNSPARIGAKSELRWRPVARRDHTNCQVPALSGLFPPSPASHGSECPQLNGSCSDERRWRSPASLQVASASPRGSIEAQSGLPVTTMNSCSELPQARPCGRGRLGVVSLQIPKRLIVRSQGGVIHVI